MYVYINVFFFPFCAVGSGSTALFRRGSVKAGFPFFIRGKTKFFSYGRVVMDLNNATVVSTGILSAVFSGY